MPTTIEPTPAAVEFFKAHGYPDNPALCADLARAEAWLVSQPGFIVRWVNDPDYDPTDYDSPGMPDKGWGCIVEASPDVGTSLWAITFDPKKNEPFGDTYARVVVAELARELMP